MDIQTASLSDLERYLVDLRVRFNSGDKSVENKLRAVAARVEQLKALDPNNKPSPPTNKLQTLARVVSPMLRRRCCGG